MMQMLSLQRVLHHGMSSILNADITNSDVSLSSKLSTPHKNRTKASSQKRPANT